MVKLSIHPATVRTFPYTGYLGVTPLKLEGSVCTALAADEKPLLAQSITISVRCYESRLGRVSALQTNMLVDHTEVLWSKPEGQDYTEIAELELPFRIVLPPDLSGRSTMTFPDYRVFWRIETVIHHIPISGVGCRQIKHYSLPWIRYDLPPSPSYSLTPPPVKLNHKTTKPRAPTIRYSVETPLSPVGPLDLVSITIHLLPIDPSVSIRSASLIVERRIYYLDTSTPPSPRSSEMPIPASSLPSFPTASSITLVDPETSKVVNGSVSQSGSRSPSPILSSVTDKIADTLYYHDPPSASTLSESCLKTVATSVAGVEPSGRFARDEDGVWTKTLTLQWPAAKSTSRWAIGETSQTDMVSVKFFARVKIIVSSPSGTESIELMDQELIAVATNAGERELAACKYKEMQHAASSSKQARAKSKSKSPRRRKRERTHDPMPIDSSGSSTPDVVPNTADGSRQRSAHASPEPSSSKRSSSRRPHTSAGPRDRAHTFDQTAVCTFNSEDSERPRIKSSRKRSADVANAESGPTDVERPSRLMVAESSLHGRSVIISPRNSTDTAICSMESAPSDENEIRLPATPSDHVRAWEEELAKIETRSRRSSAEMLGFAHKLKRITFDRFTLSVPVVAHGER